MQVDASEAVLSVKMKVEQEFDIPCEQQRLVFKGSTLAGRMTKIVLYKGLPKSVKVSWAIMLYSVCQARIQLHIIAANATM